MTLATLTGTTETTAYKRICVMVVKHMSLGLKPRDRPPIHKSRYSLHSSVYPLRCHLEWLIKIGEICYMLACRAGVKPTSDSASVSYPSLAWSILRQQSLRSMVPTASIKPRWIKKEQRHRWLRWIFLLSFDRKLLSIYIRFSGTTKITTSQINQQRTSYSLRSRILARRRAIFVPLVWSIH